MFSINHRPLAPSAAADEAPASVGQPHPATDSQPASKKGYILVVGNPSDYAEQVLGTAAVRLSRNKEPHTVVLPDESAKAAFASSLANFRKEHYRMLFDGKTMLQSGKADPAARVSPEKWKKLGPDEREKLQREQSTMWLTKAVNHFAENGGAHVQTMSQVNPDSSKLYIHAHGRSDSEKFYAKDAGSVSAKKLVSQLVDLGLSDKFKDVRLVQCQSQLSGAKFRDVASEKFPDITVTRYEGNMRLMNMPDRDSPHGEFHHMTHLARKFPVRRSGQAIQLHRPPTEPATAAKPAGEEDKAGN